MTTTPIYHWMMQVEILVCLFLWQVVAAHPHVMASRALNDGGYINCDSIQQVYSNANCCSHNNHSILKGDPAIRSICSFMDSTKRPWYIGVVTHALNTTAAGHFWNIWNQGATLAANMTNTRIEIVETAYDPVLHASTLNGWCQNNSEVDAIVFTQPFHLKHSGFDIVDNAISSCQTNGMPMTLSYTDSYLKVNSDVKSYVGTNNPNIGQECGVWASYLNHKDGTRITNETAIIGYGNDEEVFSSAGEERARGALETIYHLLEIHVSANTNITKFVEDYKSKKAKFQNIRIVALGASSVLRILNEEVEIGSNTNILNCGDDSLPLDHWIGAEPLSLGYESVMHALFRSLQVQRPPITLQRRSEWGEDGDDSAISPFRNIDVYSSRIDETTTCSAQCYEDADRGGETEWANVCTHHRCSGCSECLSSSPCTNGHEGNMLHHGRRRCSCYCPPSDFEGECKMGCHGGNARRRHLQHLEWFTRRRRRD